MIQNVTIGQYFPGNSFMHRLDARLKLVLTITLIVLIFFIHSVWGIRFGDSFVNADDHLQ